MFPTKKDYSGQTRRPPEKSMIFGIRAVIEAIEAGQDIEKVLIRRDMSNELTRQLLAKLEGNPTPIQKVPVEKLNQFTDKNHQSVIAFISPITFRKLDDMVITAFESGKTPLFVLLDGITDVRNFGAIARTCECAGVDALVIPTHDIASINGAAIKSSAGALHHLPVCRVENLGEAMKFLTNSGVNLVAATEKGTKNYTQCDFTLPTAIVMGSEEVGIDPNRLKLCKEQLRIPMTGKIASLNVSVSAAVMIYEAIRQRTE